MYDGAVIKVGLLDHNYVQLGYHLADSSAGLVYSFVMMVSCFFFGLNSFSLANPIDCLAMVCGYNSIPQTACARSRRAPRD